MLLLLFRTLFFLIESIISILYDWIEVKQLNFKIFCLFGFKMLYFSFMLIFNVTILLLRFILLLLLAIDLQMFLVRFQNQCILFPICWLLFIFYFFVCNLSENVQTVYKSQHLFLSCFNKKWEEMKWLATKCKSWMNVV